MPDRPKIIQPGKVEIPLTLKKIPFGSSLSISLHTPEGRNLIVVIQPKDYNWEKDEFLINIGHVDATIEAQRGKIILPS